MSTRPHTRLPRLLAVAVGVVLTTTGCAGIPADPEGTLERASGGVLRVGMSQHEPWTAMQDGDRSGVEVDLVEEFAADIDAEVQWHDGGEESLIEELHRGELDVVVGGLTEKSPWSSQAALTRPYVVVTSPTGSPEPHVMAARMGENALLVALERFLGEREGEIARQVGGEEP
jgi:ABC-type amino acid transport substrate-binding protein